MAVWGTVGSTRYSDSMPARSRSSAERLCTNRSPFQMVRTSLRHSRSFRGFRGTSIRSATRPGSMLPTSSPSPTIRAAAPVVHLITSRGERPISSSAKSSSAKPLHGVRTSVPHQINVQVDQAGQQIHALTVQYRHVRCRIRLPVLPDGVQPPVSDLDVLATFHRTPAVQDANVSD